MYEWGQPGAADETYAAEFLRHINDDLNMPRALATTWKLVKSDLPARTKKATILLFDRVLALGLVDWEPTEEAIPDEIMVLVEQRQAARAAKNWPEADALRDQIAAAGYDVEDTPEGPRIQRK